MNVYELISNSKISAKYWALYTAGFSVLTGIMTTVHETAIHELSKSNLETALNSGVDAVAAAVPFNAFINLGYSKLVDGITNRKGRFAANLFCGAVNVMFYIYYSKKLATDPGFAVLMNTITGYTLTNKHIDEVLESKSRASDLESRSTASNLQ